MASRSARGPLSGAGFGIGVVDKYPATLTVTVEAVQRPPPEVLVSDPMRGVRPKLPAGYGSGFEAGEEDGGGRVSEPMLGEPLCAPHPS